MIVPSGAQARAQRENHRLPLRGNVATPGEVATTERALGILLRAVANKGPRDETVRAGVTVRLMLDLGRDAGQLAQLWRLHLDTDDSKRPGEWGLVSWVTGGSTKHGWWLPAGVHIDSTKVDNGDSARGAVWLPVLERSRPWLERAGLIINPEKRRLLGRSRTDVQRDVATFLSLAKATLGPLGSALPRGDRLPGALAEQLAWQPTGDRTLANQLSGVDMEHSASRSYYSSLSTPKAAELYAKAMPSAICDLSAVKAQDGTLVLAVPAFAQSALTREAPKGDPDTMRSVLELLASKPDARRKGADIVAWHTDLVIRVWILLALSTAIRPLTNWVPGLQRIEPRTGGLIVLDKDRKDDELPDRIGGKTPGSLLGRARMVFLHPTARLMLRTYVEHLRLLASRDDVEEKSRDLIARHVEGLSTDALLPFLELSWYPKHGTLSAKQVGPSWIEARLEGLADAPANFARHTLRSGLMGQVPQSAIDAVLGHFDVGTEPWTNGSAFDPVAYRALLTAAFEGHFKAAGEFTKRAGTPKGKKYDGDQG